jgi:hypothetical protein
VATKSDSRRTSQRPVLTSGRLEWPATAWRLVARWSSVTTCAYKGQVELQNPAEPTGPCRVDWLAGGAAAHL